MFEQRQPGFFHKFADSLLKAINKAYFDLKPETYMPFKKFYNGQHKELLSTYRHKKLGHNFGVFVPTDIGMNGKFLVDQFGTNLPTVLKFIKDKEAELRRDNIEFVIVPCADASHNHWSVLKISIAKNNQLVADYYDSSVNKKPKVVRHLKSSVKSSFADRSNFDHHWVLNQFDDVNCGPFSHDIIKKLVNKERPDLLPKTGIVERAKVYDLIDEAKVHDQDSTKYPELHSSRFPKTSALLRFVVKYRRGLGMVGIVLGLALSAGLIVLFPPVGLAGLIATASIAVGVGTPVFATLVSTVVAAFGALASLAITGIRKLSKKFERAPEIAAEQNDFITDKTFSYDHDSELAKAKVLQPSQHPENKNELGVEDFEDHEKPAAHEADQQSTDSDALSMEDFEEDEENLDNEMKP